MLDHMFAIYLQEPFASATSNSRLPSWNSHGFFLLAYFLNQLNTNLCYKTSFPKNPNHSRQLTALTIPDNALRLCAARLYYFHDSKKV